VSSKPSVVIAFAYGASDWKTSEVRPAFERNLPGIDLAFEPIDWRPYLPSPQAHLMRFVRNREGAAAEAPARPARTRTFPARTDLVETAAERQAVAEGRRTGRVSLDPLTRPAMRVVHHAMVDRAGITMADVLGYLRDPEAVIDPVGRRLLEIRRGARKRPVVAVGLSLGGILLVDTLARLMADTSMPEGDRSPADLLVTVGSQSAALRAMVMIIRRGEGRRMRVWKAAAGRGVSARVTHLAVRDMPHSGKPDELLAAFGIDSAAIVKAATA